MIGPGWRTSEGQAALLALVAAVAAVLAKLDVVVQVVVVIAAAVIVLALIVSRTTVKTSGVAQVSPRAARGARKVAGDQ